MTQEERNALQRWAEHHKALAADVPVEDWLSQSEIDKKRKKLEEDPIKWIKYFFPKYAKYEFAPFHVRAIKRVIEHDEWYEVLSWSRELAKSTVAMFICMYLALTKRKRFFVLASATIDSAKRLLAPYKINFESNPRIRQFYGSQVTLGQWTDGEFTAKCGAKFVALGAGSAPRGARNEEVRPDVIYMDDYDTDEDCRNPETLKKKWDWFEASLYPTRSISEPTLILWCGNIIAKDCCIKKAGAKARHWDIVNIRDKDGHSTWPAKNTEEQIDTVLSNISTKSAQAEYFNNPVSEGNHIQVPAIRQGSTAQKVQVSHSLWRPCLFRLEEKGKFHQGLVAHRQAQGCVLHHQGIPCQGTQCHLHRLVFRHYGVCGREDQRVLLHGEQQAARPFLQPGIQAPAA